MAIQRRYSKKREAIYNALAATREHPSAEWLYQKLKPEYPDLSLATVYRNLNAMCEEGEIFRIPVPGQPDHYDRNPVKHEHTYCERCGELADLLLPELADLLAKACPDYNGYQLTVCTVCQQCRDAE